MKPIHLLVAASAIAAPLSAQEPGPGDDLVELFEMSQREGASDEELVQMLEARTKIEVERQRSGGRPDGDTPRPSAEAAAAEQPPVDKVPAQGRGPRFPDGDFGPRRWLVGVIVSPLDASVRAHFELEEGTGVVVESVMLGSPAAEAGLKAKDIVTTAGGQKVSSLEDLQAAVQKAGEAGKSLKVEIIRRGQKSAVKVIPRFAGRKPETARPEEDARPERPLNELKRRLDQQQKEIEALQREVRELRARLERE